MNNCVIFKEQLTMICDFEASYNSLFISRCYGVKISPMFQALYSTLHFLLIHSWKHKLWCFEKWINMEESWTKTINIEDILPIKQHEINDELQNTKKIINQYKISFRYNIIFHTIIFKINLLGYMFKEELVK